MQTFFVKVMIAVLIDPAVIAALEKLFGGLIAKYVLPTIPVAVGAAVKSGVDEIIKDIPGVSGVSGVVDVVTTTEAAAGGIVGMFPVLGQIPVLGDVLKGLNLP